MISNEYLSLKSRKLESCEFESLKNSMNNQERVRISEIKIEKRWREREVLRSGI